MNIHRRIRMLVLLFVLSAVVCMGCKHKEEGQNTDGKAPTAAVKPGAAVVTDKDKEKETEGSVQSDNASGTDGAGIQTGEAAQSTDAGQDGKNQSGTDDGAGGAVLDGGDVKQAGEAALTTDGKGSEDAGQAGKIQSGTDNGTDGGGADSDGAQTGEGQQEQTVAISNGETVTVSDLDSFIEAIAPNTTIILEPGTYNLSYQLEALWYDDPKVFNDTHEYVQISDCFDGTEMTIRNCDGLSIKGGGSGDHIVTELMIDPRYAAVLSFENCSNLYMSLLSMGHTDRGDCSGNVIDLFGCSNITLEIMDIYGCGVYGIGAFEGTKNLYVHDSTIRDCSYGPFEIYECKGEVIFTDCIFTGSDGCGYCSRTMRNQDPKLIFKNCMFGEWETNGWYFDENCVNEDPTWSEITYYPEYPDYSDYPDDYDGSLQLNDEEKAEVLKYLDKSAVDENNFNYTSWYGVAKVDPESGETVYFEYTGGIDEESAETRDGIYIWLDGDHTGYMVWSRLGGKVDITWETGGGSEITLTGSDGLSYYGDIYTNNEGYIRLCVQIDNMLVWLY
ncbi:MAG: right-handed parallel beta-helix repeat-containing protein [Lachnospiraceae bacterium]|nr:right-handed parallel beta-helix repeat-containing protein [Lachnospiraceae bacterium]